MSNFKPGQQVVCIDDKEVIHPLNGLKKDDIYTIEYIIDEIDGLVLYELTSGAPSGAYHKSRFKPLLYDNVSIKDVEYTFIEEKIEKPLEVETHELSRN